MCLLVGTLVSSLERTRLLKTLHKTIILTSQLFSSIKHWLLNITSSKSFTTQHLKALGMKNPEESIPQNHEGRLNMKRNLVNIIHQAIRSSRLVRHIVRPVSHLPSFKPVTCKAGTQAKSGTISDLRVIFFIK